MSKVVCGDCLEVLPGFPDCYFDAVVTDPPYGLEFMGKDWDTFKSGDVIKDPVSVGGFQDGAGGNPFSRSRIRYGRGGGYQAWCEEWAKECLRVLKPGGHLLAFGGTRMYHRLAAGIEDAGFEIRDSLHWIYGSGFPKSLDVSKAIDKAAGAEREVIGKLAAPAGNKPGGASYNMSVVGMPSEADLTAPATDAAKQWDGWGTALKPAHEPIVLARKPLAEKTVAANVLEWGTGAINVDGCRVSVTGGTGSTGGPNYKNQVYGRGMGALPAVSLNKGRWPSNILLSDESAEEMDRQGGTKVSGKSTVRHDAYTGDSNTSFLRGFSSPDNQYNDSGGASRFFPCFRYEAKAPQKERPKGDVSHPTVKPVALMRWLVRLVTPPGGIVLDPFGGTGTTAEACLDENFRYVLIECEEEYIKLIQQRLNSRSCSLFEVDDD